MYHGSGCLLIEAAPAVRDSPIAGAASTIFLLRYSIGAVISPAARVTSLANSRILMSALISLTEPSPNTKFAPPV
jgi:hypothetical protein